MKIQSNKILDALADDLITELIPILNTKEESSQLNLIQEDL